MAETSKDPCWAPRTDEMARGAAYRQIEELIRQADDLCNAEPRLTIGVVGEAASAVVSEHVVTWERDVNANGVPVRRYVLRGMWQVDPEAPRPDAVMTIKDARNELTFRTGDTVRYRDGRDHGRRWTVGEVFGLGSAYPDLGVSMTAPDPEDVAEHVYAKASELEVIRRAEP